MGISTDGKGEATMNMLLPRGDVWALEYTACQHSLLCIVKCYGTELLPIADKGGFFKNLVNRNFALPPVSRSSDPIEHRVTLHPANSRLERV